MVNKRAEEKSQRTIIAYTLIVNMHLLTLERVRLSSSWVYYGLDSEIGPRPIILYFVNMLYFKFNWTGSKYLIKLIYCCCNFVILRFPLIRWIILSVWFCSLLFHGYFAFFLCDDIGQWASFTLTWVLKYILVHVVCAFNIFFFLK